MAIWRDDKHCPTRFWCLETEMPGTDRASPRARPLGNARVWADIGQTYPTRGPCPVKINHIWAMFKNSDPMTPMTNLVTRWVLSHNLGVATSLAVCRMDDMPPGGQCASLAMASAVSTLGFCSGSTRFTFIDHHRSENSLASQKQRPRPCTMYRKIIVVDLGFRLSSDRTQLASLFCFCFFWA